MLLLRLIAILTAIAIATGVAAYLLTGDRKFLRFSLRVLKLALAIVLVIFGLMALERLIVTV